MEEVVRGSGSDDPMAAVHEARRRLFAMRTARLAVRREPRVPAAETRRGGLLTRLARKLVVPGDVIEGEGVLDLGRPAAAYDHGQFAVTEIGEGIWGGPSGRALAGMEVDPNCRPGPLWFLGAVEFLNAASDEGTADLRGFPCRLIRVNADLTVSPEVRSTETAGAMGWRPGTHLVPDPGSVPLTVWIGEGYLCGVSLPLGEQIHSLELWDLGENLTEFDWTRLSTFRTNVAEDLRARPNAV